MTVTISSKLEMVSGEPSGNETCCTNYDESSKDTSHIHDHTDSLLEDLTQTEKYDDAEEMEMCEEMYYHEARQLLTYDEAPEYMKHNSFIRTGYRGLLTTELCKESVFWWTNETINIWSHIFGFILFISLTVYDLMILKIEAPLSDKILVGVILMFFQACMALSAIYHTFCCRSEEDCLYFLSYDLFGIALSLYGIYVSGIYYAFWCDQFLQNFYLITVTVIFVIAMVLQIPSLKINDNIKILTFVSWAAYGVVPTFHWGTNMGWFESPVVTLLLPRVFGMYAISGTAFLIYMTKIPERWAAGKFDFVGHSHQWWHFFVVGALYYWHNTGMMYVDYRLNHACANSMRLL
ncbi:progestin and adipoQ receptor family member 3 [Anthonomus grandis grandis]|uniref:progestin and adipoQ receptor family member 3 n=1 Tax=Anthonomus grandis grandis TaxID=2921223 RepID=UPI002165FA53|nr:progestin and adipoQ receptor family member 3 [Anthonomus grandis grandis]